MSEPHYVGQDLEALADITNYQNWILSHFRPHLHGRVLEIGAGVGTLSARLRVLGTEPVTEFLRSGRS